MQSRKTTAKLMLGASLTALALGAMPAAGFAQTQTTAPATSETAVEDVIVVGARAAERSAIERKRRASTVTDSIVADDVGQFPDKNAGEAIARISGVALDIGDSGAAGGFTIRGQGPDLIRVEVDGMTTLDNTGGQTGRSAQLNELSSDLIKSVDVIKGQTADMTPGGVGGTVRIEQRNGLDFNKPLYRLNLQAANSSLNDEWTPRINAVIGRKFLDGRLGFLFNATYDDQETTQDFARVIQGVSGYLPLGDHDNSAEKTFVQQYDPIAAAVSTKAGCAALRSNNAVFPAAQRVNIDNRLNCYAQWEDYVPTYVRYGRGYRDIKQLSYQVRLDFRVSDNLTVFASYTPSSREYRGKDFNYQVNAQPSGTTNAIAGPFNNPTPTFGRVNTVADPLGATDPSGGLTTNIRVSPANVNENHYVTQFSMVRPGITVAQGAPGLDTQATVTGLTQSTQIRDVWEDKEQFYYQTGADFDFGKWTGKARAQYGSSYADREDFVFNPAAPLAYTTFKMIPSGLWTQEATALNGLDLTNPTAYQFEPTANGVSAQVDLQYPDIRLDKNNELALQLDMTRDFDGDAGIFTRFKWGLQSRNTENLTWREGGQVLANGLILSRARSIDRLRVCTDAAVTANLCTLGSVPLNVVNLTTTTQDQLYKLHSLSPAQYQAILNASIIDLPGGKFFGGIPEGAGLFNTWTTFDTEKVYAMLDEYLDFSDWDQECLFECRANDGKTYPRRSFKTQEKITSAYAMLDFESQVFGMDLGGNIGVRFQKIDVEGQIVRTVSNRSILATTVGNVTTYSTNNVQTGFEERIVNRTSQDALPSLNLSLWPIQDQLVVRYSIAKQRARPSFTQLTGTASVSCFNVDESQRAFVENLVATNPLAITDSDANTSDDQEAQNFLNDYRDRCTSRIGNPALVGYGALTQNLSLEWYPNRDTQVSFATYEIKVRTGAPEGVRDPLYEIDGNTFEVDTWEDGPGGRKTRGFELAARTSFTFLPSFLRHTGGGFNAATAKTTGSEGTLFDRVSGKILPPKSESSYYYNANLWYDDGRINARVAYQARDIYFRNLTADGASRIPLPTVPGVTISEEFGTGNASYFKTTAPQFRSKTNALDARGSYKLNDRIEFFVEGKNLLDDTQYNLTPDEYRDIGDGTEYRWDTTYLGRKYYVGLIYTF